MYREIMFIMTHLKKVLLLVAMVLISSACQKWEEHYEIVNESSETNIWFSIKENESYSIFAGFIEDNELDTLFFNGNSYSVFIPSNDGLTSLNLDTKEIEILILSHISETVFLTRNVQNKSKLKTLSGKYAEIEKIENNHFFNGLKIVAQSELYENGIFYELEGASNPKENIFQYIQKINPIISEYISEQDSVYLDLELSRAIDISDDGEIIYDSVLVNINLFELMYFPVSKEFRDYNATIVIPNEQQYLEALNSVRILLGLNEDFEIPQIWQKQVLIPFILQQGIFDGLVDSSEFTKPKLKNILGDSVIIDYKPVSGYGCSNGLVYIYDEFIVPDSLYLEGYRLEGESLAISRGLDLFAWKDTSIVKISGETSFPPSLLRVPLTASNDSVLLIDFGKNFSGDYSIEFNIKNIFPGQYQFIFRSNPRFGGVYSIYINDELQTLPFGFTEFDLYYLSGGIPSVTGTNYFYPKNGYNQIDCLTEISEYGDVKIKLEYIRPGKEDDNGLIIDFVELIPYK
ncbi:MAG: fasciclin domain-containing protein [Bacteroidales bacterium]|nr:fasciclin domain-containing protein [Bacteroidales bacterium]